ncbi:hypothetical protein [Clostridium botulinum]|uniref:hypothetical protein n=1 Tax=Clostridium botulinum TaxID=1491 RepID=UPI0002F9857E|nr:hypothetical protein [Clostridium botulinum]KLU74527.1 hypothetical protein CBC3_13375 [Clostridium botulinum V891]KOA73669.1 hypothetical protein ADU78_11865 [Clostridium botulinum]KOA92640.1 hypothetical protein ADU76_08330 [Clostridium botulinum]KOC32394.1 hypothetical protein ADU81_11640 [Clostridium botulinum]MCD3204463.1 hypothetical protein [Clostridium botulinum C/D]
MINFNLPSNYFKLTNNGSCGFAFSMNYFVSGIPEYAFSKVIPVGTSTLVSIDANATNINFTVYVYNPPYKLIPIYTTNFTSAEPRCYLATGTLENPTLTNIPCTSIGNGSNGSNSCCCCCCNPCK